MLPNSIRSISTGIVLSLILMAGCSATASPGTEPSGAATAVTSQPIATPAPATAAASPTTASTAGTPSAQADSSYSAFAQKLKVALEKEDPHALSGLLADDFSIGYWRSQGNNYSNVDEAEKALEQLMQGAKVTVDLQRVPIEPIMAPPPEVRTLVARWSGGDGRDTFAHLTSREHDGQWKWTGILIGLDYYHSPTAAMLAAEPQSYAGKEVMLAGEIRDAATEKAGAEPAALLNDPFSFVLKDPSGTAMWIEIARDVLKTRNLAVDQLKPGTTVRAIGIVQSVEGKPVLASDSLQLVGPEDFASAQGTIASYSAGDRTFTLEGSPTQIKLLETTTEDYANGKPLRAVPLGKGVRVLVIGRPTADGAIQAEAIYIYL